MLYTARKFISRKIWMQMETWFAVAARIRIYALSFKRRFRKDMSVIRPYRISRGLMLLDFFRYNNVSDFLSQYNFEGIEPFTLLIFEQSPGLAIHEIRWDEKEKFYLIGRDAASVPLIWSSAQLYTKDVIRQREDWFGAWLKANSESHDGEHRTFSKTGGTGNSNTDLLMNRDSKVFTVSITSVKREEKEATMRV